MTDEPALRRHIERFAPRLAAGPVANLARLSGGASQETWSFDVGDDGFILRRAPAGMRSAQSQAIGLPAEARVIRAARAFGAPTPDIVLEQEDGDAFAPFYVMRRLSGEAIARKVLRDDMFAEARTRLARQCGAALARIHSVSEPLDLPTFDARAQIDRYEEIFRSFDTHRPIFDLAFAELRTRIPEPIGPTLVHGDFRLGNLMVDAQGLVAALDWELAHLGDPAEDLGWLCTPSWRFGGIDKPVGGFGDIADLIAGYREAGGDARVDEPRVRFWTMMGSLKWGVMCLIMYRAYETGMDASVERAAIGRRASECELDLVLMMQGKL